MSLRSTVFALLRPLSTLSVLKRRVVVYSGANFGYSSHSKDLYLYLVSRLGGDRVVFVSKKRDTFGLYAGSLRGLLILLFSRDFAIAVTMPRFVRSECKNILQVWHGYPLKALGVQDRSTARSEAKALAQEFNNYGRIVAPSREYLEVLAESYQIRDKSVFQIAPTPNLIHLNKLAEKRRREFRSNSRTIVYAPTFRHSTETREWDLAGERVFLDFLRQNDLELLVYYHPLDPCFKRNQRPLAEAMLEAIAVITDYSSVAFDAILMDIPLLLYCVDFEKYSSERGLIDRLGLYKRVAPIREAVHICQTLGQILEGGSRSTGLRDKFFPNMSEELLDHVVDDFVSRPITRGSS